MADDQVNPRGMERVFFTLRLRRMHYGSASVCVARMNQSLDFVNAFDGMHHKILLKKTV